MPCLHIHRPPRHQLLDYLARNAGASARARGRKNDYVGNTLIVGIEEPDLVQVRKDVAASELVDGSQVLLDRGCVIDVGLNDLQGGHDEVPKIVKQIIDGVLSVGVGGNGNLAGQDLQLVGLVRSRADDASDMRREGAWIIATAGRELEEGVHRLDIAVPLVDGIDHGLRAWVRAAAVGTVALCVSEGGWQGGRGADEGKNRGGNEGLHVENLEE